jgi:hypothetical protein
MRVQGEPERRCWKVEEWPIVDQVAWSDALAPASLLLAGGLAARWRPESREKSRKGYGRWLHWLARRGWLDAAATPGERVTPERVGSYIADLDAMIAPFTVRCRIAELFAVMRVIAPDHDWCWLKTVLRRLDARARPIRDKRPMLRPAGELFAWALRRMRELEERTPSPRVAQHHRDALLIALLSSRPLRRGNLSAMEIGRHLIEIGNVFQIVFASEETKNGKTLEFLVPARLTSHLRQYLQVCRPILARANPTNRLWLSWTGKPMSGCAIHHRVTAITRKAFGVAIAPHLFRDCVATSIAMEAPGKVGLIGPMLGHLSYRTGEAHYNQAASLETGRAHQKIVRDLRRRLIAPRKDVARPRSQKE